MRLGGIIIIIILFFYIYFCLFYNPSKFQCYSMTGLEINADGSDSDVEPQNSLILIGLSISPSWKTIHRVKYYPIRYCKFLIFIATHSPNTEIYRTVFGSIPHCVFSYHIWLIIINVDDHIRDCLQNKVYIGVYWKNCKFVDLRLFITELC